MRMEGFDLSTDTGILLVGAGGGGCNALSYIYEHNNRKVDFLAIHTEQELLNRLPIPQKDRLLVKCIDRTTEDEYGIDIPLGSFGAIRQRLSTVKYRIVIIIAAFGGNTCRRAEKAIGNIQSESDSVFLFSNDYIINNYPSLNLLEAFRKSDSLFELPVRIIYDAIAETGMLNVDLADVQHVLKNAGLSAVTYGVGRGENRIQDAIDNIMLSPYMDDVDTSTTTAILTQIKCGNDEITMAPDRTAS